MICMREWNISIFPMVSRHEYYSATMLLKIGYKTEINIPVSLFTHIRRYNYRKSVPD